MTLAQAALLHAPSPIYRLIFALLIRFVPAAEVDVILDMLNGQPTKVQRNDS